MASTFPPEIEQFVQDELASGHFSDEQALLTAALEVYREVKGKHVELRDRVQQSILQADRGEVEPLNMTDIKRRLSDRLDADSSAGAAACGWQGRTTD